MIGINFCAVAQVLHKFFLKELDYFFSTIKVRTYNQQCMCNKLYVQLEKFVLKCFHGGPIKICVQEHLKYEYMKFSDLR